MHTELAIVILNYKTADFTNDCLDSLASEIEPGIVVIVVDNASPDASGDAIAAHIARRGYGDWARLVRSPLNGGFAAGNNLGIRAVLADAYMLLNSDTLVKPGALRELRAALKARPDAGMIAPSAEDGAGALQETCFTFPHPVTELLRTAKTGVISAALRRYDVPARCADTPLEPDWVPFAAVVIRRSVIDMVGLLDDGYFMYFEDLDYCLRVRAAGYGILYWPRARIVHFVGGSSNVTTPNAAQRRAPRYFYEARSRFFAKHFGFGGLWLANAMWIAGRAVSRARELVQRRAPIVRERESADIWINVLHPFKESVFRRPA
jgi:N-acetylglucosaminyl-diphospho-decaprenol L-rhamnosyltransferase